MSSLFATDLPRPAKGNLTVYLLGPGVGESQVVVFPDARCMVVDGCVKDNVNLPAALLGHLGISRIDAVVLTHPDLDHVRGVAEVVRRFQPSRIFRYPADAYVRDLVSFWLEKEPGNRRFQELRAAIDAIDEHAHRNTAEGDDVCATTMPWRPQGASYTVHFLAPTRFDRERVRLVWRKIIEYRQRRFRLSGRFERLLSGETRLGDAPNAVSVAVVIEWGQRKVLLAGDVENGLRSKPRSGWKGVLRILDDPDYDGGPRGHLVEDVDLVKVAHHGSKGAFFPDAWGRHAKSKKTKAVVAPFASSSLPSDSTLVDLRGHCDRLGISAEGSGAFARAEAAGWAREQGPAPSTTAPCLAAVLDPAGGLQLFRGAGAALFQ